MDILRQPIHKFHHLRVHDVAYGFGDPSEKMSVLINFLLQNINLKLLLSLAKSAQILLVMSDVGLTNFVSSVASGGV